MPWAVMLPLVDVFLIVIAIAAVVPPSTDAVAPGSCSLGPDASMIEGSDAATIATTANRSARCLVL